MAMFKLKSFVLVCVIQLSLNQEQLNESQVAEQIYIKLFKKQRAEQLDAIKSFKKISTTEKQYAMIILMAEKVFTVIQDSRAIIEASPYIPGVSNFPLDDQIKNALSNILENTALFSEIILRFPDISLSVLKINNNWDVILQWGIAFCHQMNYLLDSGTIKLLHLVSQELNHIERDPLYVNPYRKMEEEKRRIENRDFHKKKKRIKKGPRLSSHFEL